MSHEDTPEEIAALADQCVRDVREALGFELDYTADTLPLLDHYCREARKGSRWSERAEHTTRSVGAYFGEVVRRRFEGSSRWVLDEDGAHAWRVEFEPVFLCFNPLGAVLELLLEGDALGWNAGFITHPEADEPLREKLARLPGVSEDDFYSLSVRLEVFETVYEFLLGWERSRKKSKAPYGRGDYERRLAQLGADATASFEEPAGDESSR